MEHRNRKQDHDKASDKFTPVLRDTGGGVLVDTLNRPETGRKIIDGRGLRTPVGIWPPAARRASRSGPSQTRRNPLRRSAPSGYRFARSRRAFGSTHAAPSPTSP